MRHCVRFCLHFSFSDNYHTVCSRFVCCFFSFSSYLDFHFFPFFSCSLAGVCVCVCASEMHIHNPQRNVYRVHWTEHTVCHTSSHFENINWRIKQPCARVMRPNEINKTLSLVNMDEEKKRSSDHSDTKWPNSTKCCMTKKNPTCKVQIEANKLFMLTKNDRKQTNTN